MRRKIIVASASPRRRELLEMLGWSVIVQPVSIDESELPAETPEDYLKRVVSKKLEAAQALPWFEGALARVVADTIVVCEDSRKKFIVLHKPDNELQAREMLDRLSGCTHRVITRFALMSVQGQIHQESVVSDVSMRVIEAHEKEAYLCSKEWCDKAGGYAIQGRAGAFITRIRGSYYAIMGLPICEVTQVLNCWLHNGEV